MKAFVTGGAGFVGGAVVRQLLARGDHVTAAVRDPHNAGSLGMSGAALVGLDLAAPDPAPLVAAMEGADAVFHLAGSYRVGIRPGQRPAMWAANVTATGRVLDAAATTGVGRIVYTSTANVLGNTLGQLPDETFRRAQPPAFLSWYDETKYRAHLLAEERAANGAPDADRDARHDLRPGRPLAGRRPDPAGVGGQAPGAGGAGPRRQPGAGRRHRRRHPARPRPRQRWSRLPARRGGGHHAACHAARRGARRPTAAPLRGAALAGARRRARWGPSRLCCEARMWPSWCGPAWA